MIIYCRREKSEKGCLLAPRHWGGRAEEEAEAEEVEVAVEEEEAELETDKDGQAKVQKVQKVDAKWKKPTGVHSVRSGAQFALSELNFVRPELNFAAQCKLPVSVLRRSLRRNKTERRLSLSLSCSGPKEEHFCWRATVVGSSCNLWRLAPSLGRQWRVGKTNKLTQISTRPSGLL